MARSLQTLMLLAGVALLVAVWMRPDGRAILLEIVEPLRAHAGNANETSERGEYAPPFPGPNSRAGAVKNQTAVSAPTGTSRVLASSAPATPEATPLAPLTPTGFLTPPPPLAPAAPEMLDAPPGTLPGALVPLPPTAPGRAVQPAAYAQSPDGEPASVVPAVYGPGFDPPPATEPLAGPPIEQAPLSPPQVSVPVAAPPVALPPVVPAAIMPLPPTGAPAAAPPVAPAAPTAPPASQAPTAAQPPVEGNPTMFTQAAIVARVDGEVILAADVMGPLERFMATKVGDIPAEQVNAVRIELAKQRIGELIEIKLIYNDAKRNVPKDNFPMLEKNVDVSFTEDELPGMLKQHKVNSPVELDALLRTQGDSLENSKHRFREMYIARGWLGEKSKDNREIRHEDILAYYEAHVAEYQFAAQSRWEQLTVRFDRVRDRAEAQRKIAWMGNQIMSGRPWAEIAKAFSNGPTADAGGVRDWTTLGSLASAALDQAIFGLPVGAMSPIIEDESGLHIVRVIERHNAGQTTLGEAQGEIKEKIKAERRKVKQDEYFANLKKNAQVWTIFDVPGQGEVLFAKEVTQEIVR